MKKFIFFLLALLATLTASAQITTRIEGTVSGAKEGEKLLLGHWQQDFRVVEPVEIPIVSGRFFHEFTASDTTAFVLRFSSEYNDEGAWLDYIFFSEGGTLRLSLAKGDAELKVEGGRLSRQFHSLYSRLYPIYREHDEREASGTLDDADFKRRSKAATSAMQAARDSIITATPTPLGLLLMSYKQRLGKGDSIEEHLPRYETAMPDHPITHLVRNKIISDKMRETGGRIPDLRARDLRGNEVSLRSLVSTRFTVLDLWASWCGPCRRHSKELIPVYEKYKDKGLSIIAVAREQKDTKAMRQAMERDAYPWPSYVDLGDEFQVWQQMGAGNAGGAIFLLDAEGKVLMTNPTVEEIIETIEKALNE